MWRLFSSRNIETQRTRPGGPTHWTTLRTALLKEAAEQPAGDGRMAGKVLEQGQSWGCFFRHALEVGGARIEERLGPYKRRRRGVPQLHYSEAWEWGRVHRTAPSHPLSSFWPEAAHLLDPPAVPMGGGFDTPQAASFGRWAGRRGGGYSVSGLSVNR
jgi:hypothetical protein